MNMICVPRIVNRKLKQALESGTLDIGTLSKMGTEERSKVFEKIVGKDYVERVEKRFINKFKTDLTPQQVDFIVNEVSKINKSRAEWEKKYPKLTIDEWNKLDKAPDWAREYTLLMNNIANIVNPRNTMGIGASLKHYGKEKYNLINNSDGFFSGAGNLIKVAFDILTTPALKPLKASLDMSYTLRQGWKVAAHNRGAYKNAWIDAWKSLSNLFGKKDTSEAIMNEFKARTLVHPLYEQLVVDGKLAIGAAEEVFPTTIGEKIPLLRNLYASTNNAFTVFSQSARLNLATDLVTKYEKLYNRKLTKEELKDISTISNSITGRGNLGSAEAISSALNRLFFAPRYVKSAIDTFTMPFSSSKIIAEEAKKNLFITMGSIASIMGVASQFGDVEMNPLSSDFGKFKIPGSPNSVDLTAGLGQYITLVSREVWGQKIDSKGRTTELGSSNVFKPDTRLSLVGDFFGNKLAPALSYLKQAVSDHELYGNREVNIVNSMRSLLAPISPDNAYDYLTNEDFSKALAMIIAEQLGLSVSSPKY